ncbi:hypothetical protein LSAT2_026213 [Lamellibrachia satsuma]|nr:hypothetical protein LSAT2_026213 [Lamellibrachia satsuma]
MLPHSLVINCIERRVASLVYAILTRGWCGNCLGKPHPYASTTPYWIGLELSLGGFSEIDDYRSTKQITGNTF